MIALVLLSVAGMLVCAGLSGAKRGAPRALIRAFYGFGGCFPFRRAMPEELAAAGVGGPSTRTGRGG